MKSSTTVNGIPVIAPKFPSTDSAPEWLPAKLSPRETQIFEVIGEGRSIRQTAAAIGLSHKTVETYCQRIKLKLLLRSGAELREMALLTRVMKNTIAAKKIPSNNISYRSMRERILDFAGKTGKCATAVPG